MQWGPKEDKRLIWLYVRGVSLQFIANTHNRPLEEVQKRIRLILFGKVNFTASEAYTFDKHRWDQNTRKLLRRMIKKGMPADHIAEVLARSPVSVVEKIRQLGKEKSWLKAVKVHSSKE